MALPLNPQSKVNPASSLAFNTVTLETNKVEVKEISHNGRQYMVAPVVALVEGVLNEELVLAEEFGRYHGSWDGRPLPLGHPMDNDGDAISANSPDVLAAYCVGQMFNTTFDEAEGKLKAEMWIDIQLATKLGDKGKTVLRRLKKGQPIEVSTAYWRDVEQVKGEFAGERYYGIARNIRPDHLAILLDEEGACNWQDGCGVPRTNAALNSPTNPQTNCRCSTKNSPPTADPDTEGGAASSDTPSQNDAVTATPKPDDSDLPTPNNQEEPIVNRQEMITLLAEKTGADPADLNGLPDEALQRLVAGFQAETPAVEDNGNDEDYEDNMGDDKDDEVEDNVDDPTAPPVAEVPTSPAQPAPPPAGTGESEHLLAQLIGEFGGLAGIRQIKSALASNQKALNKANAELAKLRDLQKAVEAAGGLDNLKTVLTNAKSQADEQKAQAIHTIMGNSSIYSEAELKQKTLADLQKLAQLSQRPAANYGGRPLPKPRNTEPELDVAQPPSLVAMVREDKKGA